MPVWLVGVRLGLCDGSPGYHKSVRRGYSQADIDAHDAAAPPGKRKSAHGRLDPNNVTPRSSDPGRVFTGSDAA